jgi:hypothetical protein
MEVAPYAFSAGLRFLVLLAVAVVVVLVIWAIVKSATITGRGAAMGQRPGEPPPPRYDRSQEPVIEVTASEPPEELAEVIRENNRLLREVLEELRRRPEGPAPPSGEHLG